MTTTVGVIGAGTFGIGLASAAERVGNEVILWSRGAGRALPNGLSKRATTDLSSLARADVILIAVPSAHVRELASSLGDHLDGSHLLVHVSRGLAGPGLTTLTEVLREVTPCRRVGALAGPLVADALRRGDPGGAIVGTLFPEVAQAVRDAIAGPSLQIEHSTDVLGVELASALVGILTVAAGYAKGLGLGPSALAMLLTRGMREGADFGARLGATTRTFAGLAGMADLVAAVAGDERPDLALGEALARGGSIHDAAKVAGANIEGVTMARLLVDHAARDGVELPLIATLARIFQGTIIPEDGVDALLGGRPA